MMTLIKFTILTVRLLRYCFSHTARLHRIFGPKGTLWQNTTRNAGNAPDPDDLLHRAKQAKWNDIEQQAKAQERSVHTQNVDDTLNDPAIGQLYRSDGYRRD